MFPPFNRFNRRSLVALSVMVAVVALVAGFLVGMPSEVPAVHAAACQPGNGACIPLYRTAAVDVDHAVIDGLSRTPVQLDDSESWNITAYWNTTILPCQETSETATVDVTWDDATGWTLSNKSTTTNITAINICTIGNDCSEEYTHTFGYRLYVQVNDPLPGAYNLRQVVFTTTSIDDGFEVDASCEAADAVSPTSQTFSGTDSGTFECLYSCDNSGTSVQILYE